MAITGRELAILTARAGAGRAGAMRAAYTPRDTVNSAGISTGPFVRYKRVYRAPTTYTVVKT